MINWHFFSRIRGHCGFSSQTKSIETKNGKIARELLSLSILLRTFGPCTTISSSHLNSMQGVITVYSKWVRDFHNVEKSGFFCHSDFTWNQFWRMPILPFLGLRILYICFFQPSKSAKIHKNSNSHHRMC